MNACLTLYVLQVLMMFGTSNGNHLRSIGNDMHAIYFSPPSRYNIGIQKKAVGSYYGFLFPSTRRESSDISKWTRLI